MADFSDSTVATTTSYTALLQALRDRNNAVARQLDGSHTNLPTGAVRWNSAQDRWEKYDGSAWNPLSSLYNMNVSQLQGYQTSTGATANTIALRDAAGRLKAAAPSASTDVARKAEVDAHVNATGNVHNMTKAQIELGNVSNDQQLVRASNLSDLPNVSTARTNLGLGTAATTNSADYATASQGSLADTALQPEDSIDADSLGGFPASTYTRMEHRSSGGYTITQNAILTWLHNKNKRPDHAWIELVCFGAEFGYQSGDSVEDPRFFDGVGSQDGSYTIRKTTTTLSTPTGDFAPAVVENVASSEADYREITLSRWRLVFHAVWYQ